MAFTITSVCKCQALDIKTFCKVRDHAGVCNVTNSFQKWGRMLKRRNKPGSSKSAALMKMHSMSSTATSKSESVSRSFAIIVFDLSVKHYSIYWCLDSATFAKFQPVREISLNVQSNSQTHKHKPSSILRSVINSCKHLL